MDYTRVAPMSQWEVFTSFENLALGIGQEKS